MSHSQYYKYHLKLNENIPSYDKIIQSINEYLKKCIHINNTTENSGELYSANITEKQGEILVSFFSLKSPAPTSLSYEILNSIKENIKSNPSVYYYFLESEEYEGWRVNEVYGKAQAVLRPYNNAVSISETDKDLSNKFQKELYKDFEDSIELANIESIVNCIKKLEQRAFSINEQYNSDSNLFLIPLFRNNDGSVCLVGYEKSTLSLFKMKKNTSKYDIYLGKFLINKIDMNDKDLIDCLSGEQIKLVSKNLTHPKIVAIAAYRKYSQYYNEPDLFFHKRTINLFDKNGPLINIKNNTKFWKKLIINNFNLFRNIFQ